MTHAQAVIFVKDEIRPRYKTLNDTQFADWLRAAGFVELDVAKTIVRDLVLDPSLSLNIKNFRRSAYDRRTRQEREHVDLPGYDPYLRCLEAPTQHPEWEDQEWFHANAFRRSDCGNRGYVTMFAAAQAEQASGIRGGKWCGVVRPIDARPYAGPLSQADLRDHAENHILAGPDGPGKRFLCKYHAHPKSLRDHITHTLSNTVT